MRRPRTNYRFWVQHAENSGQGPVTTSEWPMGGVTPYIHFPSVACAVLVPTNFSFIARCNQALAVL